MFNHTSGARAKRPAHFFLGILAGAAAVGAYTLSCDGTSPVMSGTTGGTTGTMAAPAAGDVPYANAESGLGATTVQAAIDEIGTTLESATAGGGVVTGGAARSTTWTMEVVILDVNAEQLTSTSTGTLTLTATAPGQGSYETSGANIFILDGLTGEPRGTKTGKYFVVGDLVMLTGEREPGTKTAATWAAYLSRSGRTITLNNFGSVTVVLKKQ